jgi:hypothetical protein
MLRKLLLLRIHFLDMIVHNRSELHWRLDVWNWRVGSASAFNHDRPIVKDSSQYPLMYARLSTLSIRSSTVLRRIKPTFAMTLWLVNASSVDQTLRSTGIIISNLSRKRQQQDSDNYWDDCWNPGGLSARYYGFISRQ